MIEVSGLTKRYGSHLAVKDASFTINKGEVVKDTGEMEAGLC